LNNLFKIGIDLDNTIINYDKVFFNLALKKKLITTNNILTKKTLRDQIRNRQDGEKDWQKLQGSVYGKFIKDASIFPGFQKFLWRCNIQQIHVEIVSHKTIYGHFDETRTNLRDSAESFLFEELGSKSFESIKKIVFYSTLEKKIEYLENAGFDLVIDDLEKVLKSINSNKIKKILFNPSQEKTTLLNYSNWEHISMSLFPPMGPDIVDKYCLDFLGLSLSQTRNLNGRANAQVFSSYLDKEKIFIKLYSQDRGNMRFDREISALKSLHRLGIKNVQSLINSNEVYGLAAFKWIEGTEINYANSEIIGFMLDFIGQLYKNRNHEVFSRISNASDACLSMLSIENQIERRFEELISQNNEELSNFLICEFLPVFHEVKSWARENYDLYEHPLNVGDRTLSPSDFGLHNMIKTSSGQFFIDFEYFGWDDPVKLISDFTLHPAMRLNLKEYRQWHLGAVKVFGDKITKRLNFSYPLYALNWCLILLNLYKDYDWSKQISINSLLTDRKEEILHDRLAECRFRLEEIKKNYLKGIFYG